MAKINNILGELRKQDIQTWFDLGLFIDRLRERQSKAAFKKDFKAFDNHLESGGIAFITFYFAIDGITVETEKYAKTFKKIYPNIPIHYVAQEIKPEADELIHEDNFKKVIKEMVFTPNNYNKHSSSETCYYDLLYSKEEIKGNGNFIIRIAGNTVKQIIPTNSNENVSVIPVGIILSIPAKLFSDELFREGKALNIELLEPEKDPYHWKDISYAIEAGPMLIENDTLAVNMEGEGWKTSNSIKTQAARLDFTDMRGPKIAVGITKKGKLMVLMVNGRIRESVGATHFDMADILLEYGMHKAMGFDPGGSSTLVVDGMVMNISPYNKNYEEDIYSLPPEPRFVANAVMGWIENELPEPF